MMKMIGLILQKLSSLKDKSRISRYKKHISGRNYSLGNSVNISYPQNVEIGERTYINGGDIIASENARIIIGKDCLISYNVHLRTDMHNYDDCNVLINKQGHTEKDIIIEDDVWIGYGVQIMSGVTIRKGSVIAAGAVLTHSTGEYEVWGGVPARKIKDRGTK